MTLAVGAESLAVLVARLRPAVLLLWSSVAVCAAGAAGALTEDAALGRQLA